MVGAAKLFSPGLLIALDVLDLKLELAKKIGADLVLNPAKDNVEQQVMELTEGCLLYTSRCV